jgi:hypothetical protein
MKRAGVGEGGKGREENNGNDFLPLAPSPLLPLLSIDYYTILV